MTTKPQAQAVKIPPATHDLLRELTAHVSRHGWSSLGIDREDPPTHTAVIEAAIELLASRRQPSKRK
jgi:hypothetical protein